MSSFVTLKAILRDTLLLSDAADKLEPSSPLLGAVHELDSMAVVAVLAAMEQEFGIVIEDDEVSADVFMTVGSLSDFVDAKLEGSKRASRVSPAISHDTPADTLGSSASAPGRREKQ